MKAVINGYNVTVPGKPTPSPWDGVPPQMAVQHLVTLLRCRAYHDPACEKKLEVLYRDHLFAPPRDEVRTTDYQSRYADLLNRFLCNQPNHTEGNTVTEQDLLWLYDRIVPKDTTSTSTPRVVPCSAPCGGRPHCVVLPGVGHCSWFVPIASPGRWVSCLYVERVVHPEATAPCDRT